MGWLLETFDPYSRTLLQGLLNSIGPGLMLVGITWIALRSAGKTSAATRHAVWLVALIALVALPFLPASARSTSSNAFIWQTTTDISGTADSGIPGHSDGGVDGDHTNLS